MRKIQVMTLEDENQLLRQYAPQDVVSNLPQLVAQHRSANPQPATVISTPAPTLPPLPKVEIFELKKKFVSDTLRFLFQILSYSLLYIHIKPLRFS